MASDIEFTVLTQKEADFIKTYFTIEHQFMPKQNFFNSAPNILFRRHAVSIIANHSRSIGPDTFIPYLAMNYFDCFFSINKTFKEDMEGCNNDTEKVRLIAISCLSISAKLRIKDFSVQQFLRDNNLMITPQMIMAMEFNILHELRWKIRPVTPFTYLNFYYRYFKKFGGYKRRCINEIIVQAQGDHTFVHYPPTLIASTAFMAASRIAYPSKYNEIAHPSVLTRLGPKEQVVECATKMFQLCRRMKIQIEIPESSVHSTSSKVLAYSSEEEEETALIRQKRKTGKTSGTYQVQVPVKAEKVMVVGISDKKGVARVEAENRSLSKGKEKAVEVTETSVDDKARVEAIIRRALENGKALVGEEPQTQIEGFNSEILELVAPKKLMIFELKWPTEVPPLELLAIKNALQEAEDEEEVEEELQIDDQGTGKIKNCGCIQGFKLRLRPRMR
ncbi:hypothetical protein TSUD_101000 [Trifolium subterraneum]|uniref:B-like cyclin n=1 Tax=Trifolium subterraneum TaxID=3900 RepID=A0A2Z6NCS9_TRISU|nr:hypothetical protein TSUD_101000 [Trifolium subterraneum]